MGVVLRFEVSLSQSAMLHRSLFTLTLMAALGWSAQAARAADAAGAKVDFNYDIRPIISTKCFHCHGPDEGSRKAKLRLDLRKEALKEHEDGQTIVPGSAADSALGAAMDPRTARSTVPASLA